MTSQSWTPSTQKLMDLKSVKALLTKIRYPDAPSNKTIHSATLSRWRSILAMSPRRYFTPTEVASLGSIANLLARGFSYEEIETELNPRGQSYGKSRFSTQPRYQAPRSESSNIWAD